MPWHSAKTTKTSSEKLSQPKYSPEFKTKVIGECQAQDASVAGAAPVAHHAATGKGVESVDMHEVAKFAASMGWPLPKPRTALDRLAEQFSNAARVEMRRDDVTGRPYRANLAVTTWSGSE